MSNFICVLILIILFLQIFTNFNYESINNSNNIDFFLYYTNWCGYSKKFLNNIWPNLEVHLKKKNIKYELIDGDKHKDRCIEQNIKGFPTILLKVKNKYIEYEGPHDINEITSFINNNLK